MMTPIFHIRHQPFFNEKLATTTQTQINTIICTSNVFFEIG